MLAASCQYSELAGLKRQLQQCATAALKQPQAGAVLQVHDLPHTLHHHKLSCSKMLACLVA